MNDSARNPRILVIRRRYLGDLVLLGSVLRNLRLHWPAAEISLLAEAGHAGIAPANPDLHDALIFPRRGLHWPGFIRRLRRARFTHVLDFDNTEKTALVTRVTGAAVRATYDRERIPFRWGRLYTHTAKVTNDFYDSHHITETFLALPAAIGVPIVSREVRLVPRARDVAAARRLVPPGGRKVLVHPGTRSVHRIWPLDRFAAVCDRLQDDLEVQVFLTAGPTEVPLVDGIRRHARTHLVALPPPRSAGELAGLMAQFELCLCHDSGPMHIAAAVGTPVVALFGSQNTTIWRPLGERHTVLQTPLPCACPVADAPTPCVRGDSYRSYCVRMLDEGTVYQAVAASLPVGRSP